MLELLNFIFFEYYYMQIDTLSVKILIRMVRGMESKQKAWLHLCLKYQIYIAEEYIN
jgi:hypothetical protein